MLDQRGAPRTMSRIFRRQAKWAGEEAKLVEQTWGVCSVPVFPQTGPAPNMIFSSGGCVCPGNPTHLDGVAYMAGVALLVARLTLLAVPEVRRNLASECAVAGAVTSKDSA